jgi:hypothetical protein
MVSTGIFSARLKRSSRSGQLLLADMR